MNVGSLFTGVGGFDLGLERAGHTIAFQCEADANCRKVLRRHWPEVPIYEDVVTCEPTEPADLICGGFPCQDLSVAGKRAGLAGERSGLFFEAARIADTLLKDGGWLLIENVPGLLSSQGGRDFGIVLSTLAELGFYDLAWRVLDSRYFGVPQRRRRVFVLARRARGRRSAEVLLEPESGGGDFEASGQAGESLAKSTPIRTEADRQWPADYTSTLNTAYGTKMGLGDQHAFSGAPCFVPGRREGATDTARCLVAGDRYDSQTQDFVLSNHSAESGHPQADPDGVREASGVPGRVDASVTAFHARQTPISSSDHAPTLRSKAYIGVLAGGSEPNVCAYDPKPDGPRYAQMGNAVTVQVAEWIGRRLNE